MTTIETNQSLEEYANDPERITEYSVWNDDVTTKKHTEKNNTQTIKT